MAKPAKPPSDSTRVEPSVLWSSLRLQGAFTVTYWEFTGRELVNCTCEYGCPCQFNALPDKGHCYAVAGIQIDEGKHGDTRLEDLKIGAIFKWPGAIHEGNGEALVRRRAG